MPVEKVQLGVTAIKELMDNGYTWNKKDDLGFGSIQEKFMASDVQIAAIRKHPLLKDLETTARIFVIIDDTKDNGNRTTPLPVNRPETRELLESVLERKPAASGNAETVSQDNKKADDQSSSDNDANSFSAFANL